MTLLCIFKTIESNPWMMLIIGIIVTIYIQNKWDLFFNYIKANKHRNSNDLDSAVTILENSILNYKQSKKGYYKKSLRLLAYCLNNSNKKYKEIENLNRVINLYESLYSDLSKKRSDKDIYYIIDYCKALFKKSQFKEHIETLKKQNDILNSIEDKALKHIQLRALYLYERGKYFLNLSQFENTEQNIFLSTQILINLLIDPSLILITRTGKNDFEHNINSDLGIAFSILAEEIIGKTDSFDKESVKEIIENAMFYFNKAIEISKIETEPKRIASDYMEIGVLFHLKYSISEDIEDLQKSKENYDKCLSIIKKDDDKEVFSKTKMNLAMTLRDMSNFSESLSICDEALETINFLDFPYLYSKLLVTKAKTYALMYKKDNDFSFKENAEKLLNLASLVINSESQPKYQIIIDEVTKHLNSD